MFNKSLSQAIHRHDHEPLRSLLSWFQEEAEAQHGSEHRACKVGEGGARLGWAI